MNLIPGVLTAMSSAGGLISLLVHGNQFLESWVVVVGSLTILLNFSSVLEKYNFQNLLK